MQILNFSCKNQILTAECPGRLVVAESRKHIYAQFELDSEWNGLSVTAIFTNDFESKSYAMQLTTGRVEIPPEALVEGRLRVSLEGLGKGGAYRLPTAYMDKPLIVHRAGALVGLTPEETAPELWEQALAIIGPLSDLDTLNKSSLVAAINEVYRTGGGGGTGGGGLPFELDGKTLIVENGVLRVNTANKAEQDNTLPITSAAVHTTVGNIELLLSRI